MRKSRFTAIAVSSVVAATLAASPALAVVPATSGLKTVITSDYTPTQWALNDTRVPEAWNITKGDGITVGVIDTGVDAQNPDLAGQIVDGYTITSDIQSKNQGQTVTPTKANDFTDEEGHGTHVSGIIAAKANGTGVTGAAPHAKILPIKVDQILKDGGFWALNGLTTAIKTATAAHVDIISMSIGGADIEYINKQAQDASTADAYLAANQAMCSAITAATQAGIPVVIAAGNEGSSGNPLNAPADCDDAISVSALNAANELTYWSSYDPSVDVAAPGSNILSTMPTWTNKQWPYGLMSGTSMATPLVSGILALTKAAHPGITVAQIRDLIDNTSVDRGPDGKDPRYGAGVIDAAALVGAAEKRTTVTDQKQLGLGIRNAVSNDSNAYVALWSPPAAKTLPTGYTLNVWNRSGTDTLSKSYAGNAVRGVFVIPATWGGSSWATLTATYADGSSVVSVPTFTDGVPNDLTNVKFEKTFSKEKDGQTAVDIHVSWDPIDTTDAAEIQVNVFGSNLDQPILDKVHANADGTFPTSTDIRIDHWNMDAGRKFEDSDIKVWAFTLNGGSGMNLELSDGTVDVLKANTPLTMDSFLAASRDVPMANVTGIINGSWNDKVCGTSADCNGAKVLATYKTLEPVSKGSKKLHWVTRTHKLALVPTNDAMSTAHFYFVDENITMVKGTAKVYTSFTLLAKNGKATKFASRSYLAWQKSWGGSW